MYLLWQVNKRVYCLVLKPALRPGVSVNWCLYPSQITKAPDDKIYLIAKFRLVSGVETWQSTGEGLSEQKDFSIEVIE